MLFEPYWLTPTIISRHFKLTHMTATKQEDPFEEKRKMYQLLSQETRHLILQNILGHPDYLPSLDELDHMISKNKASIADQLKRLSEAGVIEEYSHAPNEGSRDLPSNFYGLTPEGVRILDEYNYLEGLNFARAVYENTRKTAKVERHQNAPRPSLPETVSEVLLSKEESDEGDSQNLTNLTKHIMEKNSGKRSIEDQVSVARLLYEKDITSSEKGVTRKEIEKLLDEQDVEINHRVDTCLENLREVDVVERKKPPGPDVYVIGERIDEIINGQVEEFAEKEIESLIDHMDDEIERIQTIELGSDSHGAGTEQTIAITDGAGHTIRNILSQKFGIPSGKIEDYLRKGDRVKKLNEAVQAIKSHDELTKREDYGEILFLAQPYRYRLTERFS